MIISINVYAQDDNIREAPRIVVYGPSFGFITICRGQQCAHAFGSQISQYWIGNGNEAEEAPGVEGETRVIPLSAS